MYQHTHVSLYMRVCVCGSHRPARGIRGGPSPPAHAWVPETSSCSGGPSCYAGRLVAVTVAAGFRYTVRSVSVTP